MKEESGKLLDKAGQAIKAAETFANVFCESKSKRNSNDKSTD
jgi:predicted RNA-binding protein YlqC (UPF0109 family)